MCEHKLYIRFSIFMLTWWCFFPVLWTLSCLLAVSFVSELNLDARGSIIWLVLSGGCDCVRWGLNGRTVSNTNTDFCQVWWYISVLFYLRKTWGRLGKSLWWPTFWDSRFSVRPLPGHEHPTRPISALHLPFLHYSFSRFVALLNTSSPSFFLLVSSVLVKPFLGSPRRRPVYLCPCCSSEGNTTPASRLTLLV